jgi:L-lactate dehydrogenase
VAPQAVILVVTDPPDPLADLARRLAGHERVLSSGTFLDTLRFLASISDGGSRLVRPSSRPRSSARVAGVPAIAALDRHGENIDEFRSQVESEVRYANIAIIEGTGASQLGIGMATARIVEAILRDEQRLSCR